MKDSLLKRFSTGAIKAGGNKLKKFSYSLAADAAAGKYIIAVIDEADAVPEADETNNQIVAGPL